MRILTLCLLFLAATFARAALPPNVEHVETFGGISQYRLKSNGMTLLVHQERSTPVATFLVVYHVGSRDEAPGYTGSTHLLEHLIFNKSTENFGRARGHKTFQEVLYEVGSDASNTNMTTWYDRMNGYSTVPADKLEVAMKIEAERLGRALILDDERKSEMTVVRNEYEIGENNPYRVLLQQTVATAIVAHPYHWPTIGYRSDIEGVSTARLREFYKTYFHPDNAEAILVGDFDVDQALVLFDREFGGFARAPQPVPKVITVEPPQEGERRTIVRRPGTYGLVNVAWMRPGVMHPDFNALMVLDSILSEGVNSRLYRALVDTGIATQVEVNNFELRDPYPIMALATLATGRTHEEAERVIKAVVADVAAQGVTAEEVARAAQQIEVALVRSRDGPYGYARTLGDQVASAHWKRFVTLADDIRKVTAEDVQRVARTYLVPERATVGWFVPLAPSAARAAAIPLAVPAASSAAAASIPPGSAMASERVPFAQRTVRRTLSNGITLDVVRNASAPTVAVRGLVFAGNASAPGDQPALAALTSRMLARGTARRSKEEIGRLLDAAGATRSYAAAIGDAGFAANGLARDLGLMLEVLGEELRSPAFTPAELEKARQELETDYLRADDDTFQRAMLRLEQMIYAPGHPYYPRARAEKVANLRALGIPELRAFHAQRYTGRNMIVAVVGDVDPEQVIRLAEAHLGRLPAGQRVDWPATERPQPLAGQSEVVTLKGKSNTNLVLGAASGLRRSDPDYEAALVGNAALGQNALSSRIGRRVRDTEGLSYSVFSRFANSEELDGFWFVNVNVAPQNLGRALASTRQEIEKYAREGATAAEVEAQKSHFAGNYQVGLATNAGVASALLIAERYGFGPSYLDDFPKRVLAVTVEQANAATRRHLRSDKLNLVVSGDVDRLPD